jgi:2-polyprenyl-6-hydroxyphenyl methylase/3-demethylubiquinone-9 3-methyltransferase
MRSRPLFDHTSDPKFLAHYARASQSEKTLARFARIMDRATLLLSPAKRRLDGWQVVDIGCGAGTQALLWAQAGHHVRALDVNASLIGIGERRARERGADVRFVVGSATHLPFAADSADIVLLPELLEHVADWEACLREAVRILAPGGLLYLSTSNRLCPRQQEFNLPLYSWYPSRCKAWCVRKALTSHPQWANHARYPAVHWFTYYGLQKWFAQRNYRTLDRFDVLAKRPLNRWKRKAVNALVRTPALRLLGHITTEGTTLWAFKPGPA